MIPKSNLITLKRFPLDLDFTEQEHLLGDFDNILFNKDCKELELSFSFPLYISNKITTNIEENYSFEYTKNYPNKVDSINAWLFFETGVLYGDYAPTIKYAYLHDKMTHTSKRTDVGSGYVYNDTDDPKTRSIEYFPSGYVSSVTYSDGTYWDKTGFTYNKQ